MFVGGGVLVRVVVQGVRGEGVSILAEIVRGAGAPPAEGHAVESSGDGKGGAKDAGHQLVSGVGVDGCAAGVSVVVPPIV